LAERLSPALARRLKPGGLSLWAAEDFVPPRVITPVEMILIRRFDDLLKEDFNGTTKQERPDWRDAISGIAAVPCAGWTVMTTFQAIFFGAMLAWTPSLVLLAWLLREAPLDELDEFQRDPT
jgi:hypothetical protein